MWRKLWLHSLGFLVLVSLCRAKVTPKVSCNQETMTVELPGSNVLDAYLKGLKNYPEPACLPNRSGDTLRFRLSLIEFARCGTSQITNQITGSVTFYNHLVIIDKDGKDTETLVKCKLERELPEFGDNGLRSNNTRRRRDVLPAGFEEQTPKFYPGITGCAPEPILSMVVKQEGRTIGQELLVQPGAPLAMEVSHIERKIINKDPQLSDCKAAFGISYADLSRDQHVYGIAVSRLDVTDVQDSSEVILVNGCSVDPYLFENFESDGDTLRAKFRAFKFPDSSYVLFQGTVNVCLGSCTPSQCSNGQIGYGRRRRRDVMIKEDDAKGLFVVKVNTLLRIVGQPSSLDDGTVLYRAKRLHQSGDEYRFKDGDVLAQFFDVNGSSGLRGESLGVVIFSVISTLFLSLRLLLRS